MTPRASRGAWRRRAAATAALALALLATPLPAPAPASAGEGEGLLPDLKMAPLDEFRIQVVNGRRLLRFTGMFVNIGAGHFELRGSRPNTASPMRMTQILYETTARTSPIARQVPTEAVARYAGDGHDHWHVNEVVRYDMWGDGGSFRGAKVGFCFLDSDPWNTSLPGHVGSFYRSSMCSHDPAALSNRMGVSVGWGDEYEWYLAWQWVDITGVEAGSYIVRAKVDPYGFFLESSETNQCDWARVRFGATGSTVVVEERGTTCIDDIAGSIFASDIAWAYAQNVTSGCAPDLFCTNGLVTREEMASFLARALNLPATSTDFFTDDETSIHEANINRLAAAGIATGCGGTRYCPRNAVTREQMASFLVRGYNLPATGSDFFTDDETSIHERDINRLAASGITGGCGGTRYCPRDLVTRGQMAAFLRRAS